MRVRTVRPALRCAVCHGDLDGEESVCPSCETRGHSTCMAELGRCPTLGCDLAERCRAAAPVRARLSRLGVVALAASFALLAHALVVSFGQVEGGRRVRAAAELKTLSEEILDYRAKHGRIPDELSDLPAGAPKDPWARDYIYIRGGAFTTLRCYGADGAPGGEGENEDLSTFVCRGPLHLF